MGKLRDIIDSVDKSKEIADDVRENLHILMSLADSKLKLFQDEITIRLKRPQTIWKSPSPRSLARMRRPAR